MLIIWHRKHNFNQIGSDLELSVARQRVLYFLLLLYFYNQVFIYLERLFSNQLNWISNLDLLFYYITQVNTIAFSSWLWIWNHRNFTFYDILLAWRSFARGRCWTASIFYNLHPNERHYSSLQRLGQSCSIVWWIFLIFIGKK